MYVHINDLPVGSKASPTVAPKPMRQKSSSVSSDVFDDKNNSGLFSVALPSESTGGSPSRKKVCMCVDSISYQLTGRKSNPSFTADKTLL